MRNFYLKKGFVVGILVLLIGVNIVSGLGVDEKKNNFSINVASSPVAENIDSSLTIFVFDKSGNRQCEVVLSSDDVDVFL